MSYFDFYVGLSFWKCGSRKIVAAVNSENVRVPPKISAKATLLNQASSDIQMGVVTTFFPSGKFNKKFEPAEKDQTFHQIKGDIKDVKCKVTEMLQLRKSLLTKPSV